MSLIAELKQARREKEELRIRLREMESDVVLFATKFQEFWTLLGMDFSKNDPDEEARAISKMEIARAVMKVGKDLTFGRLKISDLTEKWDAVSPLFDKYNHLISKKDV